jgi:hypothetical protein
MVKATTVSGKKRKTMAIRSSAHLQLSTGKLQTVSFGRGPLR